MSCHCQVRSKVGVPFKRGTLPKLALDYNFKVVKNCDIQRVFVTNHRVKWISHICTEEHSESNHQSPKTPTEILLKKLRIFFSRFLCFFGACIKRALKQTSLCIQGGIQPD